MSAEKSNITAYVTLSKASGSLKPTNILDLIKRNKEKEKREKIQKIYTLFGFAGLILFLGIFIYL